MAKYSRFPDDAKSLQAAFSRAGENAERMRSSSETGKATSGRVSDSPRPGFLKSLNVNAWTDWMDKNQNFFGGEHF